MPFHEDDHWYLMVVSIKECRVYVLDTCSEEHKFQPRHNNMGQVVSSNPSSNPQIHIFIVIFFIRLILTISHAFSVKYCLIFSLLRTILMNFWMIPLILHHGKVPMLGEFVIKEPGIENLTVIVIKPFYISYCFLFYWFIYMFCSVDFAVWELG